MFVVGFLASLALIVVAIDIAGLKARIKALEEKP